MSHGFGGAGVVDGAGPGSGGAVESHGSAAIVHATSRVSAMPWTLIMLASGPADKAGLRNNDKHKTAWAWDTTPAIIQILLKKQRQQQADCNSLRPLTTTQ